MLAWFILLALVLLIILIIRPKAIFFILGVALVAGGGYYIWKQQQQREMSKISMAVVYDTIKCPPGRPMLVTITNNSEKTLERTLFTLNATVPGYSSIVTPYSYKQNRSDKILRQGESHSQCFPEPLMKAGPLSDFGAEELEWSAIIDSVYFSNTP